MATLESMIADDHEIMDGTATVTLASKTSSTSTNDNVAGALRLPLSRSEQLSGLIATDQQGTVWSLPATNVTTGPRPGDTITDGSDVWTIQSVDKRTRNTRYRCACVLQRA